MTILPLRVSLLFEGVVVLAVPTAAQTGVEVARTYRETHASAIVRDFAEMLTYPNRARDLDEVSRAAEYIRDQMRDAGVEARLLTLDGVPPLVFGEVRRPGATRTLGLYAHYDGQPVDPSNWTHPPFEPTLYTAAMDAGGQPRGLPTDTEVVDPEWRIYARSAGDDKAPIQAFLSVLRAFRDGGIAPTSNLIFMFDGQEEAGSPLGDYMEQVRDRVDDVDM
jgi:acetylornithine deacetylase/succinyl-diaminopimelate desuccinylase-like protein